MTWPTLSIFLGKALPWVALALFALVAWRGIRRRKLEHQRARRTYKRAVDADAAQPVTQHPAVDPALCAGCGACVRACPEGDILQMVNHKAVLVQPTKCVGHGECEAACPFSAISLVFGSKTRGMELPRTTTNYETNVPGLYIAGELGGMGLIRNAVKQGRLAVEHALRHLPSTPADCDILVVGAGAAGLSASLASLAARRSYICLEQGSVGGTIYNFPRQKVVMTHPADLPLVGTMKFPANKVSKEQLLGFWNDIRKQTGLKVHEHTRFLGVERQGDIFAVQTTKGTLTARKVILAMGLRGTPRRLGVPGEDLSKVTYNLLEPAQYQRMQLAVVGAGNAAAEAAIALANSRFGNQVTLLVRGKGLDRCNQENQDAVTALARKGRIKVVVGASVKEVHAAEIVVEQGGKLARVPNQFVFVCIGAEMPFKFLQGLGIKIDKKFGEPARKA